MVPRKKTPKANEGQANRRTGSEGSKQAGKGQRKTGKKAGAKKAQKRPQDGRSPEKKAADELTIAALGASAGGLEALTDFFSEVPPEAGIAYLVVQHMDPSQRSSLAELLGRKTGIPVQQVEDGTIIEANHAYVVSPGHDMFVRGGKIELRQRRADRGFSHSIDALFQSVADDRQQRAIGIILSGTGSDGVAGAKAIKAALGMVMVQDPQTAKYDAMPNAAIAAHVEDFVLPAREMGKHLREYINQLDRHRLAPSQVLDKQSPELKTILNLIRAKTGHDFTGYKGSSITRRIQRRMGVNQIETVADYARFVGEHPPEVRALMKDFLINVTSFFRDPQAYEVLKHVMRERVREKEEGSEIRAWVAGCSTGEEAFSIAIILTEIIEELDRYNVIQFFGSDIDTEAISFARAGVYPPSAVDVVGRERLDRFFNRVEDGYQVKRDIREKVIFAVHDVTRDPPYSRTDLVSARNLLIYFDSRLQRRVMPTFRYSLNQGGILFLGSAETIGDFTDVFEPVDRQWRIYRAINMDEAGRLPLYQQVNVRGVLPEKEDVVPRQRQQSAAENVSSAEKVLLRALPPAVLLDAGHQVIYAHGDTGRYLHLPEGQPTMGIMQMIIPELSVPLATALHEAPKQGKTISRDGVRIKVNGDARYVRLTVHPVDDKRTIVTFEDRPRLRQRKKKDDSENAGRVKELEEELQYTRETLRATVEELRSANEEYQSTNEELQSANEELETSREELQSSNEELMTMNAEHQKKIEELNAVNDDMQNLLNSTDVASIFLDEELNIQRYTPAAVKIFNFVPSDAGRPLSNITSRLNEAGILRSIRGVLDDLVPVEHEVWTDEGKWYSMRVHPYRTRENAIAGLVVSFIDITAAKEALIYAESIIDTVREPLLILDDSLRVLRANRSFYSTFRTRKADTEGWSIYHLGNRQWHYPELANLLEGILSRDSTVEGYRVEHEFPELGKRTMMLNGRRLRDHGGAGERILLAIEDVTGTERERG